MNQTSFHPFKEQEIPLSKQFMTWKELVKEPYNKTTADPYTKARVILMNGIENNAVITAHEIARMIDNDDVKRRMALMRRIDSLQQQTVDWLNPANQTVLETTISYEQLATDLTSNLAQNEENDYFRQVLDFALLEDFDHLFRFSQLMKQTEGKDAADLTKGTVEIKPGRPTIEHHRHPTDEMRQHFSNDETSIKTKMNYYTIVSAEQQTELFYKGHGNQFTAPLARQLYSEIADVEEQHVTQYELVGDPTTTHLEMMALMELCEAYNYFCCAQTETDPRIRQLWETFMRMEIAHLNECGRLLEEYGDVTLQDVMGTDTVEPLIVLQPTKDYVNAVLESQVDLQPNDMEFVPKDQLPDSWATYRYREIVNRDGVPSEEVMRRVEEVSRL